MRSFHTAAARRAIRPAFKPHSSRSGPQKFDAGVKTGDNKAPEGKIWDRLNISKHEFFIRKYGNISPEKREQLDKKVERQKYLRDQRRRHELGDDYDRPRPQSTPLNPLSEYLFGTHAVLSALTAGKREAFSTLYIYNPKEHTDKIMSLAKKFGTRVVMKKSKGEMNSLCNNAVHNGVVLETKPLLVPELVSLDGGFDGAAGEYSVTTYSGPTDAKVTTALAVAREPHAGRRRYPLGLFVDGITDPQNLGNIFRSAYFLGADFLIVPSSDSARLGPVAAKAAVGALDLMPVYKVDRPMHFIEETRKNGWNVVTTSSKLTSEELSAMQSAHRKQLQSKYIDVAELPAIMDSAPMLMVVGSEGSGVRTNLKVRSDYLVGLNKGRSGDQLVDSLNVGVATGMMIAKCFE